MKTTVHAFVTTRVDFCNTVFASAPRSVTDKLQRVMNAAARLVSGTRKYDRQSRLPGPYLRWGFTGSTPLPEMLDFFFIVQIQGSHFLECQGKSGNVREFCFNWNVRELSGNFDICQGIFMENGDAD